MTNNSAHRRREPSRHQPTHDYEDHELFGSRVETNKLVDLLRQGNDSECVLFNIKTAEAKEQSYLKDVTGHHRHLQSMVRENNIRHLFPIQRFSWNKLNQCKYPNLIVSPHATGKTYTHVLHAVSKCILSSDFFTVKQKLDGTTRDDVLVLPDSIDLKPHVAHPKYIIVCSSHDNVDSIIRTIEDMKLGAYHLTKDDNRSWSLPPVAKSIGSQHDETRLSYRCQQSDIVVGTAISVMKCLKLGYIHFAKCDKIFFDDLDVLLQVQNSNLRELMKIYILQSDDIAEDGLDKSSRIHFFSRKWTDLVRQFMTNLFPQRVVLFGSVAEASVYCNMKFDVESYNNNKDKVSTLSSLIDTHTVSFPGQRLCIVTSTDEEAAHLGRQLIDKKYAVKIICDNDVMSFNRTSNDARSGRDLIFVTSDPALEFLVEVSNRMQRLDDIIHIIHATLPDDILTFDQRFRLAYKHIRDEQNGLATTIFIGPNVEMTLAKNIYDLMSRSIKTLTASKLTMRDYIISNSPGTQICWRWATTGLCRLEKLSRDDRFGSYCFDRHSLPRGVSKLDPIHPETGQVGITITHVLSPSEFYFRFESHRSFEDVKSVSLKGSENMQKLQVSLDSLKSADPCSVRLDDVRKGRIFAVYFPELSRVDRVRLLDEVKHDTSPENVNSKLEYSKFIPVVKVDYGIRVHVKVRNLITLPEEVYHLPALALRGLHLGYKPTESEPNWLCQSKERFFALVTENGPCKASAWLRLSRDGCFWFENLTISRQLSNIDSQEISREEPHRQLFREGLAELSNAQPPFLSPSMRLFAMSKWNHDKLIKHVAQAYIEKLLEPQKIYLVDISIDFRVSLRHEKYDKQLKDVERKISQDFVEGKLLKLNYIAPDVYCIVQDTLSNGTKCWNRAKILQLIERDQDIESHDETPEQEVRIEWLDYGDTKVVKRNDLYQASPDHIGVLPFQAIRRKLANVNDQILEDEAVSRRVRELILNIIPDAPIMCDIDETNDLYLYAPKESTTKFEPLSKLLEHYNIRLHQESKPQYEQSISTRQDIEDVDDDRPRAASDYQEVRLNEQIIKLLRELTIVELKECMRESIESMHII